MEYQIADVQAVGSDRDLLVTLRYWYKDGDMAAGKPADFTQEHHFVNVPTLKPEFKKTPFGWLYTTDDEPVPAWHEVNGEWVAGPDPADEPRVVVERDADDVTLDWLMSHIQPQIERLKVVPRRGSDTYADDPGLTKPRKNNRAQALGNRGKIKELKGRQGRH